MRCKITMKRHDMPSLSALDVGDDSEEVHKQSRSRRCDGNWIRVAADD